MEWSFHRSKASRNRPISIPTASWQKAVPNWMGSESEEYVNIIKVQVSKVLQAKPYRSMGMFKSPVTTSNMNHWTTSSNRRWMQLWLLPCSRWVIYDLLTSDAFKSGVLQFLSSSYLLFLLPPKKIQYKRQDKLLYFLIPPQNKYQQDMKKSSTCHICFASAFDSLTCF